MERGEVAKKDRRVSERKRKERSGWKRSKRRKRDELSVLMV